MDTPTRKVVMVESFGEPPQVARTAQWPVREPRSREVLVRVKYTPVNPSDLNVLQGKYGILPSLPAVVGGEGVGTVEKVGTDVDPSLVGRHVVAFPLGSWGGCWAERVTVPVETCRILLPPDIDLQQASMLVVNPPTALLMLRTFEHLEPGDWIVQNAANSGVGRAVVALAKRRGLLTVNVVRRASLVEELKAAGADVVLTDEAPLSKRIREATHGAPIKLALNAVGGTSATELSKCLAEHGTLVTYGAMGLAPVSVPNGLLIFKDIRVRGFWLTNWEKSASLEETRAVFDELIAMIRDGSLHVPVAGVYSLDQASEALQHALQGGREGKVLFQP